MLGSGNPTPYDLPALAVLVVLAIVLLVGCILGQGWPAPSAGIVRRGAVILAALTLAAVLVATPTTNGIVGAGRLLTLWPAALANAVLFAVWSWRAGQLPPLPDPLPPGEREP